MTVPHAFFAAMLLLFITPGPDMIYVIARSVGQGLSAGLVSALGIGVGCFVHIFAVAFGLAGLLRTVPLAYNFVPYLGVAYLIYRASGHFLATTGEKATQEGSRELDFLAFLPQFVPLRAALLLKPQSLA